jgi:hypothetical protein
VLCRIRPRVARSCGRDEAVSRVLHARPLVAPANDVPRALRLWLGVLGILLPWSVLPETTFEAGRNRLLTVAAQRERPLFDEAQSAQALIGRLFQSRSIFDSTPTPLLFELPFSLVAVLRMLATCGIVGITAWRLRKAAPEDPRAIALVLTACALILDPGWSHYFVVLCYAQPVLLAAAGRTRRATRTVHAELRAFVAVARRRSALALVGGPDLSIRRDDRVGAIRTVRIVLVRSGRGPTPSPNPFPNGIRHSPRA